MNKEFETYYLAKTWKRIVARIIDIIIISLIPGMITLFWFLIDKNTITNWISLIIMIIINYLCFSLYFIILPWKMNGQTLGKKILGIKLAEINNKISLKAILLRETILVFIPITLAILAILLASLFLASNVTDIDDKTTKGFWISVLVRIIYSFIFAWYIGIMITTKIDKKHQLFYDRKYKIFIINKNPLLKKNNIEKNKEEEKNIIHIHLKSNQPGNISQKELDEIQDL